MAPLLRHFSDGKEHATQDTVGALAAEMGLSEEERSQVLPSGKQSVFTNRIAWAKSHFKRAGLLDSTRAGVYRITDRGREVLAQNPQRIDLKFLDQFPGHREFRTGRKGAAPAAACWRKRYDTAGAHRLRLSTDSR